MQIWIPGRSRSAPVAGMGTSDDASKRARKLDSRALFATSSSSMEVRIWIARSFGDLAELQWCGLRRNELTALPDSFGTPGVWHLYSNVLTTVNKGVGKVSNIPATSLLHKWLQAEDETERTTLAREIQKLAVGAAPEDDTSPDAILRKQLRHLNEEIEYADLQEELAFDARFGTHPLEGDVNPNDLVVKAPNVIQLRIPARIAAGRSFVVTGLLDATNGKNGTVQLYADTKPIVESINPGKRVITIQDSPAHKAIIKAFDDFRDLFPRALCYSRVVPVDEVVTLTLFYREDDTFARLFLTEEQRQSLDALWDEFLFVAHEPTRYVGRELIPSLSRKASKGALPGAASSATRDVAHSGSRESERREDEPPADEVPHVMISPRPECQKRLSGFL